MTFIRAYINIPPIINLFSIISYNQSCIINCLIKWGNYQSKTWRKEGMNSLIGQGKLWTLILIKTLMMIRTRFKRFRVKLMAWLSRQKLASRRVKVNQRRRISIIKSNAIGENSCRCQIGWYKFLKICSNFMWLSDQMPTNAWCHLPAIKHKSEIRAGN